MIDECFHSVELFKRVDSLLVLFELVGLQDRIKLILPVFDIFVCDMRDMRQ
jgi:hypothetical protein